MTKLMDIQVREIRRLFKTKMSKQKDMSDKYGVSIATINNIIGRRAYKHIVDEEIVMNQDKQYSCRVQDDCSKCFKNSSLRTAHERRHTKPYKCTVCLVCYCEKGQMKFCERKHNNNNIDVKLDNIQTTVVDDETWFLCNDISELLGYKDIKDRTRHFPNSETRLIKVQSNGRTQNSSYLNMAGLKRLIVGSRKPNSLKLCEELGINVLNHKYECKESESLGAIMKAFSGEKMQKEHTVLNYRIDLYFPDYNLAIECDENGHDDRSPAEEKRRHKRISKKIDCQWLRFNPDKDDFNIFEVINQIFTIIKTKNI